MISDDMKIIQMMHELSDVIERTNHNFLEIQNQEAKTLLQDSLIIQTGFLKILGRRLTNG